MALYRAVESRGGFRYDARMRSWLAVGLSLALGGSVLAAPAKGAAKKAPAKAEIAPLVTALNGTAIEEAAKAADGLGASADPAAGVGDGLVDRAAIGGQALRQHAGRHAVDDHGEEHLALARGQGAGHRGAHGGHQLGRLET